MKRVGDEVHVCLSMPGASIVAGMAKANIIKAIRKALKEAGARNGNGK